MHYVILKGRFHIFYSSSGYIIETSDKSVERVLNCKWLLKYILILFSFNIANIVSIIAQFLFNLMRVLKFSPTPAKQELLKVNKLMCSCVDLSTNNTLLVKVLKKL